MSDRSVVCGLEGSVTEQVLLPFIDHLHSYHMWETDARDEDEEQSPQVRANGLRHGRPPEIKQQQYEPCAGMKGKGMKPNRTVVHLQVMLNLAPAHQTVLTNEIQAEGKE